MTENTTTLDHVAGRTTWIGQCADRYINWAGCPADTALEFATACAEQQAEEHGPNPAEWEPPADAADEDMSYWGD